MTAHVQRTSTPDGGVTRRGLLGGGLLLGGAALISGPTASAAPSLLRAPTSRGQIRLHRFTGERLRAGHGDGVRVGRSGITLGRASARREYTDVAGGGTAEWEYGSWTSPVIRNGFDLSELVASWNAQTPGRSWVEVQVRGRTTKGEVTGWFVMARWCRLDTDQGGGIHRTTVEEQDTDVATVATDTLVTQSGQKLREAQVRVLLMRPVGGHENPSVSQVAVVSSDMPDAETVTTSKPGRGRGHALTVPAYSQEIHAGHYPQWNGGGEAWCSPTSTSMVTASWGRGPSAQELAWVEAGPDRQVDYTARNTYDYTYEGCGNWPFNTAYAGGRGLSGFVTRLRGLDEAEPFILAGVPLVLSVSFEEDELDGAGYGTNGHLMVLRGFDKNGDPMMNDPASHLKKDNAQVPVTYRRGQLENAWVPKTSGTAYVISPHGHRLPRGV